MKKRRTKKVIIILILFALVCIIGIIVCFASLSISNTIKISYYSNISEAAEGYANVEIYYTIDTISGTVRYYSNNGRSDSKYSTNEKLGKLNTENLQEINDTILQLISSSSKTSTTSILSSGGYWIKVQGRTYSISQEQFADIVENIKNKISSQ